MDRTVIMKLLEKIDKFDIDKIFWKVEINQ